MEVSIRDNVREGAKRRRIQTKASSQTTKPQTATQSQQSRLTSDGMKGLRSLLESFLRPLILPAKRSPSLGVPVFLLGVSRWMSSSSPRPADPVDTFRSGEVNSSLGDILHLVGVAVPTLLLRNLVGETTDVCNQSNFTLFLLLSMSSTLVRKNNHITYTLHN